ncbi:MAG: response regulator transcription factor [Oscillospiraceae bacterium]|nr:response regulator transcription factor [Oscillospiraceae bacterium]
MLKDTILICEDERSISNFISTVLTTNGYEVLVTETGASAYTLITSRCPDLVLLDLGLPDMDGLDIIRAVREWSQMPIIVVSARMREKDKVEALDLGADDYIAKPFGTSELLARIRTALRHTRTRAENASIAQSGVFQTGELRIDYDKRLVFLRDEDVHLTQSEYKIVAMLGKSAGKVLTYDAILRELWGPGATRNNQILRVNMANIRRKIEENPAEPSYIFTEIGVGYRMADGE